MSGLSLAPPDSGRDNGGVSEPTFEQELAATLAARKELGPAHDKELIAGFWLWEVASLQEAIDWVKRCPNPHEGESEIEIRQVFTAEDFGEAFTPELREREEKLRAQVEKRNAS